MTPPCSGYLKVVFQARLPFQQNDPFNRTKRPSNIPIQIVFYIVADL
jgi:hypothetical protein